MLFRLLIIKEKLHKYRVRFKTPTVCKHKKFCFGLSAMTMHNAIEDEFSVDTKKTLMQLIAPVGF